MPEVIVFKDEFGKLARDWGAVRSEAMRRLKYDAETGIFTRLVRGGPRKAGSVAGSRDSYGYVQIRTPHGTFLGHRLAWLFVHGEWPDSEIDHINGVRDDNRISNLRMCSRGQNMQNISSVRSGRDGRMIGASLHKMTSRWQASIQHQGTLIYLGLFDTEREANAAYLSAKSRLHEFCGKPRGVN